MNRGGDIMSDDRKIEEISEWLKHVHFRRNYLGGVKEQDVWNKISELNMMYQEALQAEKIKYDTMMEWFEKTVHEEHEEVVDYDE